MYRGQLDSFSRITHEQSVEWLLGEELQGDTDTALLSGVPSLQLIELKVCLIIHDSHLQICYEYQLVTVGWRRA
jgi:hypothetical protein